MLFCFILVQSSTGLNNADRLTKYEGYLRKHEIEICKDMDKIQLKELLLQLKGLHLVSENTIQTMKELPKKRALNEILCLIRSSHKQAKDLYEVFKTMECADVAYHIRKAVETEGGNVLEPATPTGKINT